jgi:hypothetical protein
MFMNRAGSDVALRTGAAWIDHRRPGAFAPKLDVDLER